VTINGGTGGGSCNAPVAAGGCALTPTTVGVKTIQAAYSGDGNFNTSLSATTTHTVHVQIAGVVRNGITLAPIVGETMVLGGGAGCLSATTTTNAAGAYSFTGAFAGPCFLYPVSTYSEPFQRNYASVLANITNADFLIWANAFEFPRKVTHQTQYVVPGASGTMPIILNSLDNEVSLGYSITYDINPFAQPPVFVCGANAPGCTITNNTSVFGKVGVTITPAGGVFTRPDGTPLEGAEAAGPKEIAKINFQSLVSTTLPSADFVIGSSPVANGAFDVAGHNLLMVFNAPIRVVFAQGIEGDVAGRNAGNGAFEAADVVQMRRFVSGLDTPVATHNEYQRADTAPSITRGDGSLSATDLVQVRRYVAGLDASVPSGGAGAPNPAPIAPPAVERPGGEVSELTIGNANTLSKARVSVPVNFRANGNEAAMSFTIRYDASKLSEPTVELAAGLPDGVTLTANTNEPGAIRILVDAATALAFASKDEQAFIDLSFNVRETAASGDSSVEVDGLVISDGAANEMSARSVRGKIAVVGSNLDANGAKLGGEIQIEQVDLVEEWLDGSFAILRPRLEGEASVPVNRPSRHRKP
ncbi:MAG: cohesin domain-containing protein, partial [Pyrinomonadaceae bacterium]